MKMVGQSGQQVVYQADQGLSAAIQHHKKQVGDICRQYLHRPVQVQTIDGHSFEGTIAHVDGDRMYLQVPQGYGGGTRFGSYYSNMILTLVLFELLVITLLI
ncbi:hypothetical protein [Gorillibacterium massiliense]|uniref:hypothetical protein n=1 Tax=Gorillibacterium massiliense TaxID=1280390 RepID=UPI0004B68032|nr:hypothetical protein [Gorillibacterium massiliense]